MSLNNPEKCLQNLAILRTWTAVNPKYDKGLSVDECHKAVKWLDDAYDLINTLWHDIDKARPCFACKNHYKCDPNDDRFKMRFWAECGEFSRPNWEWRGDNNG